jgi:hypothetical protein
MGPVIRGDGGGCSAVGAGVGVPATTQSEQHIWQRRMRTATAPIAATTAREMVTIAAISSPFAIADVQ